MRHLLLWLIMLMAVMVGAAALAPVALADHYYAGNSRSLGAGVKAEIRTPSTLPVIDDGAIANFVSNIDDHDGATDWVQVGWNQGDGIFRLQNGELAPTVPKAYREVRVDAFYDFDVYGAQPLGDAWTYECLNIGPALGEYKWRTLVAGSNKGEYYGFADKSPVVAESEIVNGYSNDCMAGFNNVQYKGDYSYMNFNQDNRFASGPFWLIWYYTYKYSTHANDL
jgi:hypothetical protein